MFPRRPRSSRIRGHNQTGPVALSETQSGWQVRPNRAMFLAYERSLQPGLVGAGPWRTPSAPRAAVVHGLLQLHAHSPVIEQGRADIARLRKRGTHYLSSDPGRTAPSIFP